MYINFEGKEIRVEILNKNVHNSKNTGNELQELTVEITFNDEETHEDFKLFIKKAKVTGIYSTDGNGNIDKKWKCTNDSYSFRSGESVYRHTVKLEEMEALRLDSLILDNILKLNPHEYSEKFEEDALIINLKVKVTTEEEVNLIKLIKNNKSFPVIRKGINNEAKEMRFGQTIWSKHERGNKYDFCLVEKCYDDHHKSRKLFEPMFSNMQNTMTKNSVILDSLLSLLTQKGIISNDEVNTIHTDLTSKLFEENRKIYLVPDVDIW